MRKSMISLLGLAVGIIFISCSQAAAPGGYAPGQTVEAYAYVHGGYVGRAEIKTDEAGSLDIVINEAFLPHTLAIVDMEADEWNEDNTVFYEVRGNVVRVAKYISYAGKNYTGVTVGNALAYVESDNAGQAVGNTILEKEIIRNEANMADWFSNIANEQFVIYTEFDGTGTPVTTTAYGSLFKRDSSYWNFGIGWQGNVDAIAEAAAQYGTGFSMDEISKRGDSRWVLADAVTSATASDFKDYFGLIQKAVGKLKMQ